MFEGDYAEMRGRKNLLISMEAKPRVSHAQTRERGPPLALAGTFMIS